MCSIQPNYFEQIAVYNDALNKLKANFYYLYSQDTRLWFGVNSTLRKYVEDNRGQYSDDDIEFEIEKRLKNWKVRGQFKSVHICPKTSADVPDEQTARLVILFPKYFYVESGDNPAINEARKILDKRWNVPRMWKNMLLFMAADYEKLKILKEIVRDYLAWKFVKENSRSLNLDSLQLEDAENNLKRAEDNFKMKTSQAYCKIFVPEKSDDKELNRTIKVEKIECLEEENISAASNKFIRDENLLTSLGQICVTCLNKRIWRDVDFVKLSKLWDYFAQYYYLPRLIDKNVLFDTVRRDVERRTFGLAEDFQDGKFIDLKFGDSSLTQISPEYLLVKSSAAKNQLEPEPEIKIIPDSPPPTETPQPVIDEPEPLPTFFR